MTLDDAMKMARKAAMEQLRRSEERFIETHVEKGTLSRRDAEQAVASFRDTSLEAIDQRLDEIQRELTIEFARVKH